jgi:hypothetical protein
MSKPDTITLTMERYTQLLKSEDKFSAEAKRNG